MTKGHPLMLIKEYLLTKNRLFIKKLFLLFVSFTLLVILVLLPLSTVYAADIPEPSYYFYVNDYANILDSSTKNHIISTAGTLEEKTTAQLVVVTVDEIESGDIERFSNDLFNEWGIGSKAENNGVLMLIDVGGSQSRIEVGYGLEGILPDGKTGRIQDEFMIPYFKEGDFSEGILQGFDAIVGEVYKEYGYEYDGAVDLEDSWESEDAEEQSPGLAPFFIPIILLIFILLDFKISGGAFTYFIISMLGRGGRGGDNRGGGSGGQSGGGGRSGGGGSSRSW